RPSSSSLPSSEACPGRLLRGEPCPRRLERTVQRLEPHEGERHVAGAAADLARIAGERRAGGRHRPFDLQRHEALLEKAAILGAGGQLLPDIAALAEIDAA